MRQWGGIPETPVYEDMCAEKIYEESKIKPVCDDQSPIASRNLGCYCDRQAGSLVLA